MYLTRSIILEINDALLILGDLTSNVTDTGVGEVYSKRVAKQIGSALDYMHSK